MSMHEEQDHDPLGIKAAKAFTGSSAAGAAAATAAGVSTAAEPPKLNVGKDLGAAAAAAGLAAGLPIRLALNFLRAAITSGAALPLFCSTTVVSSPASYCSLVSCEEAARLREGMVGEIRQRGGRNTRVYRYRFQESAQTPPHQTIVALAILVDPHPQKNCTLLDARSNSARSSPSWAVTLVDPKVVMLQKGNKGCFIRATLDAIIK
jgi:hypothetical protein